MVRINRKLDIAAIFCAFTGLLWCGLLKADTKITAEGVALQALSYAARDYKSLHGENATNWAQLAEVKDIEAINRGTYPIMESYVFVFDKIPLPDRKGDVFLIRINSVSNNISGQEGRYMLSRIEDGFSSVWLPEDKVKKMLADAGVSELPKPKPWVRPLSNRTESPITPSSAEQPHQIAVPDTQGNTLTSDHPQIQGTASEAPVPSVNPDASSKTSSSIKWPVIFVVVIGLGGSFFLLRQRK